MVTLEADKPQISENSHFSPNHKLNIDIFKTRAFSNCPGTLSYQSKILFIAKDTNKVE